MIDKKKFYNIFHGNSKIQKKIIGRNNFTYKQIIKIIEEQISGRKKIKILDYGCGTGTLSLYLAKLGHEVIGVDLSSKAIEIARKNLDLLRTKNDKLNFYCLQNKLANVRENSFDLILCIEVIEHVKGDNLLINYFTRNLKKGGKLIISTPSYNAPLLKTKYGIPFDKSVGHLRRYSVDSLSKLFLKSSLKIEKIVKYEGVLRNSLYLIPFLRKFIRFMKRPLSDIFLFFDNISLRLFGESNFILIAQKK